MLKIYHNPRCSKSRECENFLATLSRPYQVIEYMKNPLSKEELKELITKLNIAPIELIRTKETEWIEHYKHQNLTDEDIVEAIIQYPKLMERPVVVNGDKAVIARPFDKVNDIL